MNTHICMSNTQDNADNTHIHINTRTGRDTLKKNPSNSRAHISLRIQAAIAGPRGCCFSDISLPKGIYFILTLNLLSPQFSQYIFLKYLEASLRIWPQHFPGVTPGPSACLLPPLQYIMFSGACLVQTWQFYSHLLWSSLLRYSDSHPPTIPRMYFSWQMFVDNIYSVWRR